MNLHKYQVSIQIDAHHAIDLAAYHPNLEQGSVYKE